MTLVEQIQVASRGRILPRSLHGLEDEVWLQRLWQGTKARTRLSHPGGDAELQGAMDGEAPVPESSALLWLPQSTEKGSDLTCSVVFSPCILSCPLGKAA